MSRSEIHDHMLTKTPKKEACTKTKVKFLKRFMHLHKTCEYKGSKVASPSGVGKTRYALSRNDKWWVPSLRFLAPPVLRLLSKRTDTPVNALCSRRSHVVGESPRHPGPIRHGTCKSTSRKNIEMQVSAARPRVTVRRTVTRASQRRARWEDAGRDEVEQMASDSACCCLEQQEPVLRRQSVAARVALLRDVDVRSHSQTYDLYTVYMRPDASQAARDAAGPAQKQAKSSPHVQCLRDDSGCCPPEASSRAVHGTKLLAQCAQSAPQDMVPGAAAGWRASEGALEVGSAARPRAGVGAGPVLGGGTRPARM